MKLIKPILWILGIFLILAIIASVALVTLVNPNDYKVQIAQIVKQQKHRTLLLEGDLKLTVFPSLGVDLAKSSLSEFESDKIFAQIGSAHIAVELFPLLFQKKLSIDHIKLNDLQITLTRDKNGKTNIDDLLSKDETKSNMVEFDIQGIELHNSQIDLQDEMTHTIASFREINLESGRIADKTPSKIDIQGKIFAESPRLQGHFDLQTGFEFDLKNKLFQFSKIAADMDHTDYKQVDTIDLAQLGLTLKASILNVNLEKQTISSEDLTLKAHGMLFSDPFDIHLSAPTLNADMKALALRSDKLEFTVDGKRKQDALKAEFNTRLIDFNWTQGKLKVDDLKARANGNLAGFIISESSFSAPHLDITQQAAQGDDLRGQIKLSGKQNLEGKFVLSGLQGNAEMLKIKQLQFTAATQQAQRHFNIQLNSPMVVSLIKKMMELPNFNIVLQMNDPSWAQKSLQLPIKGDLRLDQANQTIHTNFTTSFDETTVRAQAKAQSFTKPAIHFDLDMTKLNLDRYLPSSTTKESGQKIENSANNPENPIDFNPLKSLNLEGTAKIGYLQMHHIKASNINATIKAVAGQIDITPFSAQFYQGMLKGHVSVNANSQRFIVKQNLTNVNVHPLLVDVLEKDILEGRGNIALDISTTGNTINTLKKSLNGTANIVLKDGAFKGINLAKSLRDFKTKIGLQKAETQSANQTEKTDFSELSGSFKINHGIAHNEDLTAKSPFLRATGNGDIDLGNNRIDYLLNATIVNTSTGQGGKDLIQTKNLTIPVKLTGPLDQMSYRIDWGSIGNAALKEKKQEIREELRDKVRDKLKNLLK